MIPEGSQVRYCYSGTFTAVKQIYHCFHHGISGRPRRISFVLVLLSLLFISSFRWHCLHVCTIVFRLLLLRNNVRILTYVTSFFFGNSIHPSIIGTLTCFCRYLFIYDPNPNETVTMGLFLSYCPAIRLNFFNRQLRQNLALYLPLFVVPQTRPAPKSISALFSLTRRARDWWCLLNNFSPVLVSRIIKSDATGHVISARRRK